MYTKAQQTQQKYNLHAYGNRVEITKLLFSYINESNITYK